ncbi:MFS transporter [Flexivirga caeni]|uniref:MFS transporter n=1 Tax=Flexivirga caeni TaxID=2294115 RepID=A0A3M9M5S8_9MICO|nr:MFS transporter [Flexivirga caeni]RNI19888.1 MFS transporter [Flexivirga caeni]
MESDAASATAPSASQSTRPRLWSLPGWRVGFPASLVSRLGDFVFDITVVLWISTEIAPGRSWTPAAVSGVLIAAAAPVLFVGPLAGAYTDRYDRRRVLLVSNTVQAAAVGSLLLVPPLSSTLGLIGQLSWIYCAVMVTNAAGQFFMTARSVMIAATIPEQLRNQAFAEQGAANRTLAIIGPPLAAPLMFTAGVDWALGINALSFLVATWLLARVRWESEPNPATAELGLAESMRQGARVVLRTPVLLAIGMAIVIAMIGAAALNVLEVFFVTNALHQRASMLGILSMCDAVGMVLGSLAAPRLALRWPAGQLIAIGLLVSGVTLIAYSRCTTLPPALVFYALIGVPVGMINVLISPLWMKSVAPELLGRSLAWLNAVSTAANLVSMAAAGWLVSTVLRGLDVHFAGARFRPVDSVFTAAGVMFIVGGLVVFPILRREEAPG